MLDMNFRKSTYVYRVHKGWENIKQKYHPTWEIVRRGDIIVFEAASTCNLADLFTMVFHLHVNRIGVRCDIL